MENIKGFKDFFKKGNPFYWQALQTINFSVLNLFSNGEQGCWFDNSDLSTLFQDAAGTIPVTGPGQPVGLQLDKSGRGNHRYQTAASSRPMLRLNPTTGAYYLETDGSDDWMVTNAIDFTSTDKVTLMTGVRKLSDAGYSVLVELSPSIDTNTGTFSMEAPRTSSVGNFGFRSKGTVVADANSPSGLLAPYTAVLTGVGNISGPSVSLRTNGVQATPLTTSQGTGTYGNHPAYFFRRGGITLPFNGHEYGSICVGRLCTAAEIAAVERLLAQRTGVTLA